MEINPDFPLWLRATHLINFVLIGIIYVVLLFATGLWQRIIPTSWDVSPEAWETLKVYLGFRAPGIEHFTPYDSLQMLGYTFVIFILAPFLILIGIAMAPAIRSRFPWYVKLFGGHQGARSLHFIAMVLMTGFVIMHVGLVFWSMATTTWSTWSSAI